MKPNAHSTAVVQQASNAVTLTCTVNGDPRTITAPPLKRLLDVLRQDLQLTGTKEGCGEGECGSCSVLLNGELVNSCLIPLLQVADADILTIEGLAARTSSAETQTIEGTLHTTTVQDLRSLAHQKTETRNASFLPSTPTLHRIQQSFLSAGGAQCGICTAGMILATHHLLQKHPQPTLLQMQEGLSGNLCRCTGYTRILDAVRKAALQKPSPAEIA